MYVLISVGLSFFSSFVCFSLVLLYLCIYVVRSFFMYVFFIYARLLSLFLYCCQSCVISLLFEVRSLCMSLLI